MRADVRIAVTGAAGVLGQVVRTALARHDVPLDHLLLLDRPSDEAILSEYAGRPTLIQGLSPESVLDREVIFLCGSAQESARCLDWERKAGAFVVDLSGATAGRAQVPLVNLAVNPEELANGPRLVAAPHAISFALTSALAPIERVAGIERAAGMVLRPVSDFGEAGIEELQGQTLSLLNFGEIPKEVFGRQLAFNLLPESAMCEHPEGTALHVRLAAEIDRVFGWATPRAALRLMVAPVFHGHSVLIHVVVREPISAAVLRKALGETAGITLRHGPRAELTPVEIVEREEELAVDAVSDEADERGFWVSLVGSQFREAAATNAVEIAGRLLSG